MEIFLRIVVVRYVKTMQMVARQRWLSRASSILLLGGTVFTLADLLSENHLFAGAAMVLIVSHILLCWHSVRSNSKIMFLLAILSGLLLILAGGEVESLALAASRALYLPALLTVMAILRVAATRSKIVSTAAHFLVTQSPSRRFALLASGSHIFGILLNLGGIQLLLTIALSQRNRLAPTHDIGEVQGQRITNAVLRGFGATILWSPMGLAINMLIPMMPSIDYISYLPYGLGLTVIFFVLGWIFDRLENTVHPTFVPPTHEGAGLAMVALLGLVLSITGLSAVSEALIGIPLRAAILIVIPLVAVLWVLLTERQPFSNSLTSLAREGFKALPDSTSEICLIGASAFLGFTVVEILPVDHLRKLFESVSISPGAVGCIVILLMTAAGQLGLSPMVSALVCTGAIISSGIDVPDLILMIAVMCGWSGTMLISPFASPLAIAVALTGKPAHEVGLKWNGSFVVCYYLVIMIVLLIAGAMT